MPKRGQWVRPVVVGVVAGVAAVAVIGIVRDDPGARVAAAPSPSTDGWDQNQQPKATLSPDDNARARQKLLAQLDDVKRTGREPVWIPEEARVRVQRPAGTDPTVGYVVVGSVWSGATPAPVFADPQSSTVIGYLVDPVGFVDRATFESPGFSAQAVTAAAGGSTDRPHPPVAGGE